MNAEAEAAGIRAKQRGQPDRSGGGNQTYTVLDLEDDAAKVLAEARERAFRAVREGRA